MTEQTYRTLLSPFLHNPDLLDQVFKEMFNGRFANKLEREQKWKEPPSDSTLPGCIGEFGKPTKTNGPCSRCRDKDFCENSKNGFGIEVEAWQCCDSRYSYPIIESVKHPEGCFGLGNADYERRSHKPCSDCAYNYVCGYIYRT